MAIVFRLRVTQRWSTLEEIFTEFARIMKTSFFSLKNAAASIFSIIWLLAASPCLAQDVAGIGVALNKENGGFVVKQVLAGGPAASSGKIKMNDRIIAIAEGDKPAVKTEGLEISKIIQMIRGTKGTTVHLTIQSGAAENAEPQIVSLVRGEIKALSAAPAAAGSFESTDTTSPLMSRVGNVLLAVSSTASAATGSRPTMMPPTTSAWI